MGNNLLITGLPGLDHAIATLQAAGYTVTRNVRYCGWDYVDPNGGRRIEGAKPDELFQEAAKVAATTTKEAMR